MTVKRFFELREELFSIHRIRLVIDFSSWGCGLKTFTTYEQFEKFVNEEFNDERTVLKTARLSSLYDGTFSYMCLGRLSRLPMRIENF